MNDVSVINGVQGVIGCVYSTPRSMGFAEEDENTYGWQQISESTRVVVVRVRLSHSTCVWRRVDNLQYDGK